MSLAGTEGYESVLLVKSEVFVYKIPPRTTNRGYRANEWNLNSPDWNGRMRLVTNTGKVFIKLEDKNSGELFAQCPIETYPGVAVEAVSDSSRYFVLRIQDDNGRNAFIGVGFADRSDSFDLNVALQDHFKWLKKEHDMEQEKDTPKPALDLGFKEGETIKISMKIAKKDGDSSSSKSKAKTSSGFGGGGFLPPPPAGGGGIKLPAPPGQGSSGPSPSHQPTKPQPSPTNSNNADWVQF